MPKVDSKRGAAVAILLLAGMALVWWLRPWSRSPSDVVAAVRGAGALAAVAFLLAFALVQPLGLSGHIFVLAGVVLWPPMMAFSLGTGG